MGMTRAAGEPEWNTSGDERIGDRIGHLAVEDQVQYGRLCFDRLAGLQCLFHRCDRTQDVTSQIFQHLLNQNGNQKFVLDRGLGRPICLSL